MSHHATGRYSTVAIILHWLMSFIILCMLAVGLYMATLPVSPEQLRLFGFHKEFGILVLMLAVVRVSWRITHRPPTLPGAMPAWQKFAAHSVHYAFYGFMFAMPLTGWMMSSASGLPVSFFGLFVMPNLIEPNEAWREILQTTHRYLAYGLILSFLTHIGAVIQHQFIYKDNLLRRMWPW